MKAFQSNYKSFEFCNYCIVAYNIHVIFIRSDSEYSCVFVLFKVTKACKSNGGFYLGSIGGPAAILAQNCIKKVEQLEYPELGEVIF